MAFNFKNGKPSATQPKLTTGRHRLEDELPKLSSAQLSKLTKEFPSWLRDNSGLKDLPGIYVGVLGQVQLQPQIMTIDEHRISGDNNLVKINRSRIEYMNRFTDTDQVHKLLSASRLSNEILATIWAHVNKTFPGRLTNREVCLALALIAIFQRLENEDNRSVKEKSRNPFELIKLEKKPPVPKLYPLANVPESPRSARVTSSKSIPDDLSSGILLVDIQDSDTSTSNFELSSTQRKSNSKANGYNTRSINLIDMEDGDRFEIDLFRLTQVWQRFLIAMKATFKRCYDILMVENVRSNALEALKSGQGSTFIKHLCLCYPLAHNIKHKIDELRNFNSTETKEQTFLFTKDYIIQIEDLMASINEYWAVLINLFHESGQTKFIELIMDGLNHMNKKITSKTLAELTIELDGSGKPDVCSICHCKFYLNNDLHTLVNMNNISTDDKSLLSWQTDGLISDDTKYYYHARCANFWLNHVDSDKLPFVNEHQQGILSPSTL